MILGWGWGWGLGLGLGFGLAFLSSPTAGGGRECIVKMEGR